MDNRPNPGSRNDNAGKPSWTPRVFGGGLRFGHNGPVGGLRGKTLWWTLFHLGALFLFLVMSEISGDLGTGSIVFLTWATVIALTVLTRGPRLRRRLRKSEESREDEP